MKCGIETCHLSLGSRFVNGTTIFDTRVHAPISLATLKMALDARKAFRHFDIS